MTQPDIMWTECCAGCHFSKKSTRTTHPLLCRRFPAYTPKYNDDWCGEYQQSNAVRGMKQRATEEYEG